MKNLFALLLLGILMFNCGGSETVAPEETVVMEKPMESDEERMNQIAPPPPVCVYLTEAEALSFFEPGVQIPMAGSRAPSSFNSCQYTIESSDWSGFLVLEMPEVTTKVQSIRDEVAGAAGADAVKIGAYNGRIMNDGRILSVEAGMPFRVKFSALPKQGFPVPFDAAQRRELIVKLAEAVIAS